MAHSKDKVHVQSGEDCPPSHEEVAHNDVHLIVAAKENAKMFSKTSDFPQGRQLDKRGPTSL